MAGTDFSHYTIYDQPDTLVSADHSAPVYRESIFHPHLLDAGDMQVVETTFSGSGLAYWILGLALLFLSLMHLSYGKRIRQGISAFFTRRKLEQMGEEGFLLMHPVQYSYILFFLLLAAVFTQHMGQLTNYAPSLNYLVIAAAFAAWILTKTLLYIFSGLLYNEKQVGRLLVAHYASYFIVSSYILLPLLLASLLYNEEWVGFLSISILFILFIFRFFYSFLMLRQRTIFSLYQIFLYLCALEIAPSLILLKLVSQRVISF